MIHVPDFIAAKKKGQAHSPAQIKDFIDAMMNKCVDDCQLGAWLMAVLWQGMTDEETAALTLAMAQSGQCLVWPEDMPGPVVDKHSTGGVGDKLTLIVAPLLAAAGVCVPKLSGRALGHTGGTIDKLESIPGFRCDLSVEEMIAQTRRIGIAIAAQTPDLAPADGILYAIRDVTATVESIPLIAASVMSKKIAAGAPTIILDVKYGRGAFMQTREAATQLAVTMVAIGRNLGRKVRALVTNMNQPLGYTVGNALEVVEVIDVLCGKGPSDVRELSLELAALALTESGLSANIANARTRLEGLLDNGAALEKFGQLVEAQGGNRRNVDSAAALFSERQPSEAPLISWVLRSPSSGYICNIDAMAVALLCKKLGGGRSHKGDAIDHQVGVRLMARAKAGNEILAGQPLARIYARSTEAAQQAAQELSDAFKFRGKPVGQSPLVVFRL